MAPYMKTLNHYEQLDCSWLPKYAIKYSSQRWLLIAVALETADKTKNKVIIPHSKLFFCQQLRVLQKPQILLFSERYPPDSFDLL